MRYIPADSRGFTLVEVLIISPIIVLFIGTFIALLVTLTGESLVIRERNVAIHDTQSALDDIQGNIIQSTGFLSNTPALTTPQGKDNNTAAFTDVTSGQPDALILQIPATSASPNNPARTLLYVGSGTCDSKNPLQTYTVVYFVADDGDTPASGDVALFKRTILPTTATCNPGIWQRGSCRSNVMNSGNTSICKAADERLISGATSIAFEVKYYDNGLSSATARDNNATTAKDASATITVAEQVSGETVTYTAAVRASSLNSQVTL